MDIYEELLHVIDHLNDLGIDYAICGGIAVALHGYPRFTKDIDLLVQRDDVHRVEEALLDLKKLGLTASGPEERSDE